MTLRLVHDHLLRLDVDQYLTVLRVHVANINRRFYNVQMVGGVVLLVVVWWLLGLWLFLNFTPNNPFFLLPAVAPSLLIGADGPLPPA